MANRNNTRVNIAPQMANRNNTRVNIAPQIANTRVNIAPQNSRRAYVHHRKRGDVIYPGVSLKVLQKAAAALRKKKIQSILKNKTKRLKINYIKRLVKNIRPPKRKRRVYAYKE